MIAFVGSQQDYGRCLRVRVWPRLERVRKKYGEGIYEGFIDGWGWRVEPTI